MIDSKKCNKCKQIKQQSDFYKGCKTICKECLRQHQRDFRALHKEFHNKETQRRRTENKQRAVEELGGQCFDCKQTFPLCVYDFHHIDPSYKDLTIGNHLGRGYEKIQLEIQKCLLLCANCHRLRHDPQAV